MREINFETSNYNRKDELKTFITSFNDLIDKYNKSLEGKNTTLQKLKTSIDRKKNAINKLELNGEELVKREEELKVLKSSAASDIKDLEAKKRELVYTDSEVMKMEREDIDTLITSKKTKIAKIDAKVITTREKLVENKEAKKTSVQELKNLESEKRSEEESLFRTQAILKLTATTKEAFNNSVSEILRSAYVEPTEEKPVVKETPIIIEEPVVESTFEPEIEPEIQVQKEVPEFESPYEDDVILENVYTEQVEEKVSEPEEVIEDDYNVSDYDIGNVETVNLDIEDPTLDLAPIVNEVVGTKEEEEPQTPLEETSELSLLDFDKIELPEEALPASEPLDKEETNYKAIIEETFKKEGLNYDDYDEPTQLKLVENAERVLKNLIVLKKHNVPLELTKKQSEIFYNISPQDLDDLLSIITTDDDGNGMGFGIEYTFYILNELSRVNVDKLIDVYNNQFMNVNSKSGLISLLKKTDDDLGDFADNREINKETLESLGVNTADEIANNYPEFINLDNPLFLSALNLFDKDDLVKKMNADIKIVPKILEYWMNN